LHYALLSVSLLAWLESAVWTFAFFSLNDSGSPYCCPYPISVVLSLSLQVLRQTLSRATLLLVSLGYGIGKCLFCVSSLDRFRDGNSGCCLVRPKLLCTEWISLSVMTTLYFIAALFAQLYFIVSASQFSAKSDESDISSLQSAASRVKIPELIVDVLFLTWIHFALSHTIRVLTEFKQTSKLAMYQMLVRVIVVFVGLFAIISALFILGEIQLVFN
jgi:hypothetical protein